MNTKVLHAAWYLFRVSFRQRRGNYLTVVVLIALVEA